MKKAAIIGISALFVATVALTVCAFPDVAASVVTIPGFDPHTIPGFDPHTIPGFDPHTIPGFDPHTIPGFDPHTIPGFDPHAISL